ncbi:MAG: amidohydrolase family protein [Sphingobium sp.]
MKIRSLLGQCAGAALLLGAAHAVPVRAETLIARNFTLIDGRGGPAVPGSSLVQTDGRIIWVGPNAQAPAVADATVVDLTGKFVTPGFIDLHVHLGNTHDMDMGAQFNTRANVEHDLHTYAGYGFTSVAVMGTDKDFIFGLRKEQRAGRPTMARLFTSGQGLVFKNGYGGVPGITHPVATPQEAAAEVDAQAVKGVDYIKLWVDDEHQLLPKMPPEISQAIIDAAHRNGLKAFAHIFYLADAQRLVGQGIDGFVHSVRDKRIDDDLVRAMKEKGVAQVGATLSREAAMFEYAKRSPVLDDPFFKQGVTQKTLNVLSDPQHEHQIASGPYFAQMPTYLANATANVKKLADGGIAIGVGTDAGPAGRFAGYAGHWEMELMVKAGLSTAQVIRAATGGAAAVIGAKDIGTIERGKWADFVVLRANPLDNILNTRQIDAVYIAGRHVAPADRP